MKKIVLFLAAFCLMSCENSFLGDIFGPQDPKEEWVDLGLTSGTIWKSTNEVNPDGGGGLYTFPEAKAAFGDQLPTKEQWEELNNECDWDWTGKAWKVTGPNDKYFLLPGRDGLRHGYIVPDVAYYWSSTEQIGGYTDEQCALYVYAKEHKVFLLESGEIHMTGKNGNDSTGYYGACVRLVQKK